MEIDSFKLVAINSPFILHGQLFSAGKSIVVIKEVTSEHFSSS